MSAPNPSTTRKFQNPAMTTPAITARTRYTTRRPIEYVAAKSG
jgi:hypothetical protein